MVDTVAVQWVGDTWSIIVGSYRGTGYGKKPTVGPSGGYVEALFNDAVDEVARIRTEKESVKSTISARCPCVRKKMR